MKRHRFASTMVAASLAALLATHALAAAPETLKAADLPGHPERLPTSVTLTKDLDFGNGNKFAKGQTLEVVTMQGSDLIVDGKAAGMIAVAADECDLVDAANAAWAKLTPAQRAVDAMTIEKDASLWPEQVKCKQEFKTEKGVVIPAGTVYSAGPVIRGEITITSTENSVTMRAQLADTDVFPRAQRLAAVDPAKRPSRLVAAIAGKRVDADGKPVDDATLEQTRIFALYFGASWCAPCRRFSPDLVKAVNALQPANPGLTVLMLDEDDDPTKMLAYVKEEKMPFGVVPMATLFKTGPLMGYAGGGVPQLVVTDRYGKVLANTYTNNVYGKPQDTLKQLQKILASGAAK